MAEKREKIFAGLSLKRFIGDLHDRFVYQRRIRAIADELAPQLPAGGLLDVGCGNGTQADYLMSIRPDIHIIGLEVLVRLKAKIPLVYYNGGVFPFNDDSFASVLISDSLHHIDEPRSILRECLRVSPRAVFIKDHFYRNPLEFLILRGLDISANAAHGVPSIYNYFKRSSWEQMVRSLGAEELYRVEEVPYQYPKPFQGMLGKGIQFISKIALVD